MYKIAQQNLLEALNKVNPAIPKSSKLPILQYVSIRGNKEAGGIYIRTTDLDITIQAFAMGEVKSEDPTCVRFADLIKIVKSLPAENLDIEIVEDKLQIKAGKKVFRIPTMPHDEYPSKPVIEGIPVAVNAYKFGYALGKCLFCVSRDELRPAITGILFYINVKNAYMVAADGHRMAVFEDKEMRSEYTLPNGTDSVEMIIPAILAKELIKNINNIDSDYNLTIELDPNNNQVEIWFPGGTMISSKTIKGRYPKWESVIPEGGEIILFNKNELVEALKTVSIASNPISKPTIWKIDKDKALIYATDIEFELHSEMEISCDSKIEFKAGYNYQYALDILNQIDTEDVIFQFVSKTEAVKIRATNKPDIGYLLMQIRLD